MDIKLFIRACNRALFFYLFKLYYMDSIKEQMLLALYEQAINNLVDRKHQLDEDFANGVINYAEYEEHKWLISNELDSLSQ